ncbi:MAG: pyrroline-5-carboxylate reductase [Solirubrobacteraceae bacterium]
MKVLIIGAGNMGLTYAKGIVNSGLVNESSIIFLENSLERINELKNNSESNFYNSPGEFITEASIIFIAVKPYQFKEVLKEINPFINQTSILISIMAGITLKAILEKISLTKIVRAMPNLPALSGKGVTGFITSENITIKEKILIKEVLETTGYAFEVTSEDLIDATTAISGSGPGYVFYFMNAMINAATRLGFSKEEAKNITIKTLEGTTKLFSSDNFSAQEWIEKVSSKGGTTEAAINYMEKHEVKINLTDGMLEAYKRAKEIGKG